MVTTIFVFFQLVTIVSRKVIQRNQSINTSHTMSLNGDTLSSVGPPSVGPPSVGPSVVPSVVPPAALNPGLGTYRLSPSACYKSVRCGLDMGFRHIDTAKLYKNEKEVQQALEDFTEESKISRDKIHVTTKVWKYTPQNIMDQVETRLHLFKQRINTLLLHHPTEEAVKVWNLITQEVNGEKISKLGVSNFSLELLKQLDPLPTVHQFEVNPFCPQQRMVKFCQENNIEMEGHTVLGLGAYVHHPFTMHQARIHRETPVHILLEWQRQQGIKPLVTSKNEGHLKECFECPTIKNVDTGSWLKIDQKPITFYKKYGEL